MSEDLYRRNKADIQRNFNAAAGDYDRVAVLQRTVGERLLERLDLVRLEPQCILDLGSGTGSGAAHLGARYPAARIIQLDQALDMLRQSRRQGLPDRQGLVCAAAEALPLGEGRVDLAFSSLMLQWASDPVRVLQEAHRALRPGGLFLFSSFGPDTLAELRESWARVDDRVHVNVFADMHDVGDALVKTGFADPVMETERFTLMYEDGRALMKELKVLGAGNVNAGRRRTLTGRKRMQQMLEKYENRYGGEGDGLPATFEVVYGHAWAAEAAAADAGAATRSPGVYPVAWRRRKDGE